MQKNKTSKHESSLCNRLPGEQPRQIAQNWNPKQKMHKDKWSVTSEWDWGEEGSDLEEEVSAANNGYRPTSSIGSTGDLRCCDNRFIHTKYKGHFKVECRYNGRIFGIN